MNVLASELALIERRIAEIDPVAPTAVDADAFSALVAVQPAAEGTDSSAAPPAAIASMIERSAARYGVDPELVRAVIRQESGFDQFATSSSGAQGLMQLMPLTARDLGVSAPYDAGQNIEGGTRLLRTLLDRFGGDARYALAAYNAGPATVERYGGVPPYAETQNYVARVLGSFERDRG
jgi:soluble lytic murein transglycosylase-like protein